MGWNKRKVHKSNELFSCILENQIEIMRAMKAQAETYEHTRKYGMDRIDRLEERIKKSEGVRKQR